MANISKQREMEEPQQNLFGSLPGGHYRPEAFHHVPDSVYGSQPRLAVRPFVAPANIGLQTQTAPKRVLVVDDEDYIADLLVEVLAEQGYETLVAYDGFDGLELAINQHPDLLITDIMMPGLSGLQLVEALRHRADTMQLPVIMISAGTPPAAKFANTLFMRKPFDLNDILDCVERLLVHA